MRFVGQLCLLFAFVGSGFSTLALLLGWHRRHVKLQRAGVAAAGASFAAISVALISLLHGLLTNDFRIAYVAQYASRELPWQYALSSLWVGQAGSLLLWTWLSAALAMLFLRSRPRSACPLRTPTFGLLNGFCWFLTAVMVFGADPLAASVSPPADGAGLSPILQHPSMLIHPPIVFFGYALWAIPCALALSALATGQVDGWVRDARRWALAAWATLGCGILMGAAWAYGELGWGGYWSWDPVENGSLIPWLVGTSALHAMMAWRCSGTLKKSACLLSIATFALCNLSTFLTRSGIFSSLHAFSKSPIGWLFLALMVGIALAGSSLVLYRRRLLAPTQQMCSIWSREAMVAISAFAFLTLTLAICVGTLSSALSGILLERQITVGPNFYNHALWPTAFVILLTTALAPLLRWNAPPQLSQRRALIASVVISLTFVAILFAACLRHPIALMMSGLSMLALAAMASSLLIDQRELRGGMKRWRDVWARRREYGGFVVHVGLFCLVIGVTGSSLGVRRQELIMSLGETATAFGRKIHFASLNQTEQPDKLRVAAELEISDASTRCITLTPAQHYYYLASEWTSEVAIDSTWRSDFYTILEANEGDDRVRLTFVETPLISCLWLGGWIMGCGALMAVWPQRMLRRQRDLPIDTHLQSLSVPQSTWTRAASIWVGLSTAIEAIARVAGETNWTW